MSYEEDLAFANKILRFRDAVLSGRLFEDHAFKMVEYEYDKNNIEITFNHSGGVGNATIAYFQVNKNHKLSYTGLARMIINQNTTEYTIMGDSDVYTVDLTEPTEEWYFQKSLIHPSDRVLTGSVLLNTLLNKPMEDYNLFIFMSMWLDKIINRMDQSGIV